jgi:WD40 repeat protein
VIPEGPEVVLYSLRDLARGPVRVVGRHDEHVSGACFRPDGRIIASYTGHRDLRLWSMEAPGAGPLRVLKAGDLCFDIQFDDTGSLLAAGGSGARVWDLRSPGSEPFVLNNGIWTFWSAFHPGGDWLFTAANGAIVEAWPLDDSHPILLSGRKTSVVAFAPDGNWLATAATGEAGQMSGEVEVWGLKENGVEAPRTLFRAKDYQFESLYIDAQSRFVLAGTAASSPMASGTVVKAPIDGGVPRTWNPGSNISVGADGRFVVGLTNDPSGLCRVLDTVTGEMREVRVRGALCGVDAGDRMLFMRGDSLRSCDMNGQDDRLLQTGMPWVLGLCQDRETLLLCSHEGQLSLVRTDGSDRRMIPGVVRTGGIYSCDVSKDFSIIVLGYAGGGDAVVIRSATGQSYRIPIDSSYINSIAIDPRGRWIASAGEDGTYLWRIPTGTSPLDLPRDAFLAKVHAMKTLEAVADTSQPFGYRIAGFAIPDWRHPPRW